MSSAIHPRRPERAAEIPYDDTWARKHNENRAEVRRLQASAALVAVVCLAVAGLAWWLSDGASWAWALAIPLGLFALGALAMIAYIPRRMGSLERTYAESELIPAVVAEVRPRGLTLLALADRAVDRTRGSDEVFVSRSCEKLPGHHVRVGERVPCVAVVGNRAAGAGANAYRFLSPMPLAWGTSDAAAIRDAERRIPAREWDLLSRSVARLPEVQTAPDGMLPLR